MKNISEIQNYILEHNGLKTSVKIGKGSMVGYLIVTPIFQGGCYPDIDFKITRELVELLKEYDTPQNPCFCSVSSISVVGMNDDRINMKKERKPKQVEEMTQRTWGSKNSQVRLDKAISRNAKNMRNGNTAKYW